MLILNYPTSNRIINNYIKQENEDFEILPKTLFDCPLMKG